MLSRVVLQDVRVIFSPPIRTTQGQRFTGAGQLEAPGRGWTQMETNKVRGKKKISASIGSSFPHASGGNPEERLDARQKHAGMTDGGSQAIPV
jgi:hypothetical protein